MGPRCNVVWTAVRLRTWYTEASDIHSHMASVIDPTNCLPLESNRIESNMAGSDVIFKEQLIVPLLETIIACSTARTAVLMCMEVRNEQLLDMFTTQATMLGFSHTRVRSAIPVHDTTISRNHRAMVDVVVGSVADMRGWAW